MRIIFFFSTDQVEFKSSMEQFSVGNNVKKIRHFTGRCFFDVLSGLC